ncbi:hypothetical protein EUTSA_v10012124mg [Eutrema salsugineum]|uniref:DUF7746 domain-containing protein n=1 Tax=Eutrema salsugineum TaxID=72664 RepID=V4KUG5_EUTSA|nr:hypothetical protein EUTSA_v10012124mg [Eutrema salsugineum]
MGGEWSVGAVFELLRSTRLETGGTVLFRVNDFLTFRAITTVNRRLIGAGLPEMVDRRLSRKSPRKSKGVISSHETVIDDFQDSIDNWEILKVHKEQMYQISKLIFLRTNYSIKIEEQDIKLTKPFEIIHLFSKIVLKRHRENGFKYIHTGLVQVGIKPLSKEGLNTSILPILRDTRFKIFEDSLLSSIESNLCTVITYNYEMIEGSIPIVITFRVHYKAMTSAFSSKVKFQVKNLLQTYLSRSNYVIPRYIQWKDINLPDEWVIEGVVQPKPTKPHKPLELNTCLKHIEQYHDGKNSSRNEDKTVAELLIAGFSGQLKGWWDNYLNNQQHSEILDVIKTDEDNVPILDNFETPQQDAVATLVIAITLHFIGDPSEPRDMNAELLSNIKCKRLSDFHLYKNAFLTRVLLRLDSNQPFWKEKFLAGLPTLQGEKVRNKIRDSTRSQIID